MRRRHIKSSLLEREASGLHACYAIDDSIAPTVADEMFVAEHTLDGRNGGRKELSRDSHDKSIMHLRISGSICKNNHKRHDVGAQSELNPDELAQTISSSTTNTRGCSPIASSLHRHRYPEPEGREHTQPTRESQRWRSTRDPVSSRSPTRTTSPDAQRARSHSISQMSPHARTHTQRAPTSPSHTSAAINATSSFRRPSHTRLPCDVDRSEVMSASRQRRHSDTNAVEGMHGSRQRRLSDAEAGQVKTKEGMSFHEFRKLMLKKT